MIQELLNAGIWTKTSRLISEIYGKKIDFKFLTSAESQKSYYTKDDDLLIPLSYKKEHLGEIIIYRGATMDNQEKEELVDLVHFLIEPKVYSLRLQEIEKMASISSPNSENVIHLFRKKPLFEESESDDLQHKKSISQIIHLKSKSTELRRKVAFKIHEISGSMSFFNFSDVSKSIHSLQDLLTLTDSTIFIEDILLLNKNEIDLLCEFSKRSVEKIQFLIGSNLTEIEIEHLPCDDQLKKDLQAFIFDIDKVPVAQQTSHDILELLFFSLDSSIS